MTDETLTRLARELVIVAKGGSAIEIRALVQDLMPDTKVEAEEFLAIIRRMKLAAEALESSAHESYISKTGAW